MHGMQMTTAASYLFHVVFGMHDFYLHSIRNEGLGFCLVSVSAGSLDLLSKQEWKLQATLNYLR
jgi:hypothetical protein